MIWLFLVLILLCIPLYGMFLDVVDHFKAKSVDKKKAKPANVVKVNLSWPAENLLKKNGSLPIDSRIDNLRPVLAALDVQYGGAATVSRHFSSDGHGYGMYNPAYGSWNCTCNRYRSRCQYSKYKELNKQMDEVLSAVKRQKHQLEVAKVQPDLDMLDEVMAKLRNEKTIIEETTAYILEK